MMNYFNRIITKAKAFDDVAASRLVYGTFLATLGMSLMVNVHAATTTPTITTANGVTTVSAATCEFAAVKAAVAAARDGQIVAIPPGNCDWGANQLMVEAGIEIKGAGRHATILRRTAASSAATYLVRINCYNGRRAKFSDMTLIGANIRTSEDRGLGLIGGCVDFVVTRSRFTRFVFAGIEVRGNVQPRGVIYNNEFLDNYSSTLRNLGYGVVVYGDGTWPALELGSQNAVFVEDNYLSGNRHHIASNNSARYVFRYNVAQANDLTKDYPQVDAHGYSSSPRGTRSWEIYNNKFFANVTSGRNFAAIGIRGGDGVIFNNTYGNKIANPVVLMAEGGVCGTYPVLDQVRQAYITDVAGTIPTECTSLVVANRDYFTTMRSGYTPYTYPHPLRSR